jgi:hypothetical protein
MPYITHTDHKKMTKYLIFNILMYLKPQAGYLHPLDT